MFKVKQITNPNSFLKLKEDWNFLLKNSGNRNIFLTWEWLYTWWTFYNKGKNLFIILVESNNRLVGIAPFYVKDERILGNKIKSLRVLGDEEVCSEQLDVIVQSDFRKDVCEKICDYLDTNTTLWDILHLMDFKKNSFFVEILRKYSISNKFKIIIDEITVNPYLTISSDWDTYFQSLSRNQRKNYRNYTNKLQKKFNHKFESFTNNRDLPLDEVMSQLIFLHEKKWTQEVGSGVFKRKRFREFHLTVAKEFFDNDWLKLFLLWIDNTIKGVFYCFEYENILFAYQLGYEPALKEYSIGKLVITWSIKCAIESGLYEVDFLRGENVYKYKYTNGIRNNISVLISKNNLKGHLAYYYYVELPKIKSIIKYIVPNKLWAFLHKRKYLHKMGG